MEITKLYALCIAVSAVFLVLSMYGLAQNNRFLTMKTFQTAFMLATFALIVGFSYIIYEEYEQFEAKRELVFKEDWKDVKVPL